MVIEILNTGLRRTGFAQRKLWVHAGQPVIIGQMLSLQVLVDTVDGQRQARVIVEGPRSVHVDLPLNPGHVVDLSLWAGMFLIPRACERLMRGTGRFLLEFVAIRQDVRFA